MSNTKFPALFGKYILLDRLASGGMAEVYRAKVTGAEEFQRLVAIKCMLPNLVKDETFINMFVDEAKLASQLSHANIVQIYELGRIEERLYIAMELINGRDLRHVIKIAKKQNKKVPLGFAAYVVARAAEGLDAAHSKTGHDGQPLNLVHRDVSPQNILVSYDGEVKVVDFGIAKAEMRVTETQAGVLKGKFAYMAPEQVVGQSVDNRTDIFALGAVLYETLVGEKLFGGESDLSVLEKVRTVETPDFEARIPGAPPELQSVLNTALAKDKDDRYRQASGLSEALEPLLIEDRSIFGAKKAAEFMRSLYEKEIDTLAEQLRHYATITDSDCVNTADPTYEPSSTMVFESSFKEAAKQALAGPPPPQPPTATIPIDLPDLTEENMDSTQISQADLVAPAPPIEAEPDDDNSWDVAATQAVEVPDDIKVAVAAKAAPTAAPAPAPPEPDLDEFGATQVFDAPTMMDMGEQSVTAPASSPVAAPQAAPRSQPRAPNPTGERTQTSQLAMAEGTAQTQLTDVGQQPAPDYSDAFGQMPQEPGEAMRPLALSVVTDAGPAPDSLLGGAAPATPKKSPLQVLDELSPKMMALIGGGAALVLSLLVVIVVMLLDDSGDETPPEPVPAVLTPIGTDDPEAPDPTPQPPVEPQPTTNPTPPDEPTTPVDEPSTPPDEPPTIPPADDDPAPVATTDPKPERPPRKGTPDRKTKQPAKQRGKRFGYVSVMARGVRQAKVFIDGRDAGFSPVVFYKVRTGKRKVKIVEQANGRSGKSKVFDITVTPKHTRKAPLKLVTKL